LAVEAAPIPESQRKSIKSIIKFAVIFVFWQF
jgi:hypothetical protein